MVLQGKENIEEPAKEIEKKRRRRELDWTSNDDTNTAHKHDITSNYNIDIKHYIAHKKKEYEDNMGLWA